MVDIAQEQVDTTEVVEPTEDAVEVTDEQLDADFESDDDVVAPKEDEKTPEELAAAAAAETQTPEEKAAAEAAATAVVEKTDEEKATEAAAQKITDAKKITDEAAAAAEALNAQPTEEQKAAAELKASEAVTADRTKFIDGMMEDLKDIEIGDGGSEESPMPKTIGEFAEQFPEIANGMKTMIGHLRDNVTAQMNPIHESIEQQNLAAAQDAFYSELGEDQYGHTDAGEIINSDGFAKWTGEQSQALQDYIATIGDAKEADPILTRYKAEAGIETAAPSEEQTKAAATKEAQRAKKAAKDKLHSASTRQKKSVATPDSKGNSKADLDAAWDEDDKDEDI